ncbi:MAG: protein kinase, partial [Planctomycetota bacterium]
MVSENKDSNNNQDLIKTESTSSSKTERDTRHLSLEKTNPSSVNENSTVSAGVVPADLTVSAFSTTPAIPLENSIQEDRYQILKELGEGGMGVVQLVQDRLLGREVALKKIRFSFLNLKEISRVQKNLLWRLRKEAEYTAILEHPNIVPLYDMEKKASGEIFFTMRKIEGKTLSEILREKRNGNLEYTENRLLSIFQKVCDAVRYAHSRQIVHRDLKPANMMVGKFGEVYVMDWGIAKNLNQKAKEDPEEKEGTDEKRKSFQTIGGLGTPGYMPPEQRKNASKVDHRADVFALGKILRECFTCFSPTEEFQEVLHFYENRKQNISGENPEKKWETTIPFDIQAIIRKACADKIEERYASVETLLDDLERYQKNIQISARFYTVREILWKWTQRNWKPLLLAIFLLMTGSTFFFYQHWLKQREEQKRIVLFKKETEEKWTRAIQEADQEEAYSLEILERGNYESERKVIHLLNALNHLNRALQIQPQHPLSEKKKLTLGKLLMQLCYKTRDYKLANYVAKELGQLSILTLEEKKSLLQEVEEERTRITKEHLQRFKKWEQKFREGEALEGDAEDAIFDISKMQEEEILMELFSILDESKKYFFKKKDRHNKKEEFFKVMIIALGRLENPKAGRKLLDTLIQMSQRMVPIPISKRPIAETDYLITLAQALGYSNLTGVSKEFHHLRWDLGKNGRFWSNTESVFRNLASLDRIDQLYAGSAEDYFTRALLKLESNDFSGAIADFTEAIQKNPQFVDAYIRRGWAENAMAHYSNALKNYNEAIQIQPDRADVYNDRGLVKYHLKDYLGAIADYDQALQR